MSEKKIVVIGGGSGTYTALMGLKHFTNDITAIVTMADDGGSSGRLRDEFGHLSPGDVRQCLIALSTDRHIQRTLTGLFKYRFDKGDGLKDHSFGNLFLTALTELTGSEELAILEASKLLNIKGRVLPVSTDNVRLCAVLKDGTLIRGEHNIDVRQVKPDMPIRQIFLSPKAVVYPPVVNAIKEADILVIGPGDLYTSILPNLLVRGVPEAIRECRGTRVFVCNLMTKHGETDGFKASDFLSEINRYLGGSDTLDYMLASNEAIPARHLMSYKREKAEPVKLDLENCAGLVNRVYIAKLLADGEVIRHDSDRLADTILQMSETGSVDTTTESEAVVATKPGF